MFCTYKPSRLKEKKQAERDKKCDEMLNFNIAAKAVESSLMGTGQTVLFLKFFVRKCNRFERFSEAM